MSAANSSKILPTLVDYNKPFADKVKELPGGILTRSSDIVNWPVEVDPSAERKGQKKIQVELIKIVPPDESMPDEEVRAEIDRRGYRPAAPTEIADSVKICLCELEEMRQQEDHGQLWIAAIETVFRCPDGARSVMCLDWGASARRLGDYETVDAWTSIWSFAVVRK